MKNDVIIYSHPRSGLHLLSLGLHGMAHNFNKTTTYEEIWGSPQLPSYNHFFAEITPTEADIQFDKHILLLRDYKTLASTSNFNDIQIDFNMLNGRPSGLDVTGYINQIYKFEDLKSSKMVVYFEDLVSDNNVFLEIANFIGFNYDLKKINFINLKKQIMKLYKSSGHLPSTKIVQSERRLKAIHADIKSRIHYQLYKKYLIRYNTQEKGEEKWANISMN